MAAPLSPCKWEQPRPKADPLREVPAIGWKAAGMVQRSKRLAAAARSRVGKPVKHMRDAGIGAYLHARDVAEKDAAAARLADPVELALLNLRRRGRIAYRMTVHGGPADLFFVAGFGRDLDADRLLELAERLGK